MERTAYDRFSERLHQRLAADERVLGLVALGSMSGEPPPDQWSDHDFFVITRPGEQERMRAGPVVGARRYGRGARVAGRAAGQTGANHRAQLLAVAVPSQNARVLDTLDPLRRFEKAHPRLGRELDEALGNPPAEAALRLL